MNEYVISIMSEVSGKLHEAWFVGEGDGTVGVPNAAWSSNSFHVARKEMTQLVFSEKKSEARVMVSKNMQSWLARILAQLPYADIKVHEIRITEV